MITWADVIAMFPAEAALAAVPVPAQDLILARVAELSRSFFGERYELAQIYLAAHLAIVGAQGAASPAGPVIAQSEGGVSISYAAPMSSSVGPHASTSYGRLFDDLVRASPGRVGVTS
jgi:hypothetical protein